MATYQNMGWYSSDNTLTVSPTHEAIGANDFVPVLQFSVYEPNKEYDAIQSLAVSIGKRDAIRLVRELQEWINSQTP